MTMPYDEVPDMILSSLAVRGQPLAVRGLPDEIWRWARHRCRPVDEDGA